MIENDATRAAREAYDTQPSSDKVAQLLFAYDNGWRSFQVYITRTSNLVYCEASASYRPDRKLELVPIDWQTAHRLRMEFMADYDDQMEPEYLVDRNWAKQDDEEWRLNWHEYIQNAINRAAGLDVRPIPPKGLIINQPDRY